MQVLMTGGTGFIGTALQQALLQDGHQLIIYSRQDRRGGQGVRFVKSLQDISGSEDIASIINLAGASLAARRWSPAYKHEIVNSRLQTTREVLDLVRRLHKAPDVLLSGSAIGFYGHHGDDKLNEDAHAVPGFSQQLCHDWESLAQTARECGVRVCLLRLGVVLDSGGGALVEMSRSFRLGVASWLGSGKQWLSWVHREDVIRAMQFLLARDDLAGPFNITAPQPVTAREFCHALESHYRTLFSIGMPGVLMRVLLGEMADELLLHGQRVIPEHLEATGFEFHYPEIDAALSAIY